MMPLRFKILFYFFILGISGCAAMNNLDELMALKSVADSQKDIEEYLKKQESGFKKLLDDIKSNRLKQGVSKKYILETYAEPVLTKKDTQDKAIQEILLYRYPTQYFKSERIYLYLDKDFRLSKWQLKPAE
jgi:uncharacterized protein YehS (DUF1456 family)